VPSFCFSHTLHTAVKFHRSHPQQAHKYRRGTKITVFNQFWRNLRNDTCRTLIGSLIWWWSTELCHCQFANSFEQRLKTISAGKTSPGQHLKNTTQKISIALITTNASDILAQLQTSNWVIVQRHLQLREHKIHKQITLLEMVHGYYRPLIGSRRCFIDWFLSVSTTTTTTNVMDYSAAITQLRKYFTKSIYETVDHRSRRRHVSRMTDEKGLPPECQKWGAGPSFRFRYRYCKVSKLSVDLHGALRVIASNALPLPVSRRWSQQANHTARHSANTVRPWIRAGAWSDMSVYSPSLHRVLLITAPAGSDWVGLGACRVPRRGGLPVQTRSPT